MPTISQFMTPFPFSIAADDSIERARKMMAEHGIHHLPVKEGDRLLGVISDREIARELARGVAVSRVSDATHEAFVVDLSAPADRVLAAMAERHLDSALVVKGDKLAGIFTATDACRAFAELLRGRFPNAPGGTDAA